MITRYSDSSCCCCSICATGGAGGNKKCSLLPILLVGIVTTLLTPILLHQNLFVTQLQQHHTAEQHSILLSSPLQAAAAAGKALDDKLNGGKNSSLERLQQQQQQQQQKEQILEKEEEQHEEEEQKRQKHEQEVERQRQELQQQRQEQEELVKKEQAAAAEATIPAPDLRWLHDIQFIAGGTMGEIVEFFHQTYSALDDTVLMDKELSYKLLATRLAEKLIRCHHARINKDEEAAQSCTFTIVFVGSAQLSGRDNLFNQTYPFFMEARLHRLVTYCGLTLRVYNHAMDHDLSREGPQTNHMCISNLLLPDTDVVAWDFGGMKDKAAQVETFTRYCLLQQPSGSKKPALIIINRDGPHGYSRRGDRVVLLDISPGHHAIFYREDTKYSIPLARFPMETYRRSREWAQRWMAGENKFWWQFFKYYRPFVDFATVDPAGAIWHLDHLPSFGNQALDEGKVLPLLDCGSANHEAPCDGIPYFIEQRLAEMNKTQQDIYFALGHTEGLLCGVKWGCRHFWYGGVRSHAIRGELNAIPIVQAFQDAVAMILHEEKQHRGKPNSIFLAQQALLAKLKPGELPPPLYCSTQFCTQLPRCLTSYEPNMGPKLVDSIILDEKQPMMPRKAIAHYLNDPDKALQDIEERCSPFGYLERKFAFRLSISGNDIALAWVNFTSPAGGPLIVCEPPCFIDECPSERVMHVWGLNLPSARLYLDDKELWPVDKPHPSIEVGAFCAVVANHVEKGPHILRLTTNVVDPKFVLFSHIIAF